MGNVIRGKFPPLQPSYIRRVIGSAKSADVTILDCVRASHEDAQSANEAVIADLGDELFDYSQFADPGMGYGSVGPRFGQWWIHSSELDEVTASQLIQAELREQYGWRVKSTHEDGTLTLVDIGGKREQILHVDTLVEEYVEEAQYRAYLLELELFGPGCK